jgi:hypothetical protein
MCVFLRSEATWFPRSNHARRELSFASCEESLARMNESGFTMGRVFGDGLGECDSKSQFPRCRLLRPNPEAGLATVPSAATCSEPGQAARFRRGWDCAMVNAGRTDASNFRYKYEKFVYLADQTAVASLNRSSPRWSLQAIRDLCSWVLASAFRSMKTESPNSCVR